MKVEADDCLAISLSQILFVCQPSDKTNRKGALTVVEKL